MENSFTKRIFKSEYNEAFLFALGYGIIFYMLQFFFYHTQMLPIKPDNTTLAYWDVSFYKGIMEQGYNDSTNNTGFFGLFPMIWRLSHLGIWGIISFNIVCFAIGFAILMKLLNQTNKIFWLLYLTLPSVYFAFIPYTESLFFLLAVIILYAQQHNKFWLLWVSLFLISLVRATGTFLLPALLITELLSNERRQWGKVFLGYLYKCALPIIAATVLFILWQYQETGIWFAYFKKQAGIWDHHLSIPEFAFRNIAGGDIRYHWLSALALFIDFIALLLLAIAAFKWLFKNEVFRKNYILSISYLAITLLMIITMNAKYGQSHTNVMGANRYTIVTPFFFLIINSFFSKKVPIKTLLAVFGLANAFWAMFDAYSSMGKVLTVALIPDCIIISYILFNKNPVSNKWAIAALIAFNFFVQMHLFQQFITPLYVD